MRTRLLALLLLPLLAACGPQHDAAEERVVVSCWTLWNGEEAKALQTEVDRFNRGRTDIVVELVSVSDLPRQLMLTTAGGNPPDLAVLDSSDVAKYAELGALEPLSPIIEGSGESTDGVLGRFLGNCATACRHRGTVYSLPLCSSSIVLFWNKRRFREAGLDPERPPRDLAEFDEYCRRLTEREAQTGRIIRAGFLPNWPWPELDPTSVLWLGGPLFARDEIVFARDPGARRTLEWNQRLVGNLGRDAYLTFQGSLGSYASSQNPLFTGRIAMSFDGPWLVQFAGQFAAGLEYGVAALPSTDGLTSPSSVQTFDVAIVPKGARHPRAAWAFLRFLFAPDLSARSRSQLTGVEQLCAHQFKDSPLRDCSEAFLHDHPNPHLAVFRELAQRGSATPLPSLSIWREYADTIMTACEKVRLGEQTPDAALAEVQGRIGAAWQRQRTNRLRRERAYPPPP